ASSWPAQIHPLSLHAALPISGQGVVDRRRHHDPADGELGLGQAPAVDGLGLEPVDDPPAGRRVARVLVARGPAVAVAAPAARGGHQRQRQQGREPRRGGTAGPPPRRADPIGPSIRAIRAPAPAVPRPPSTGRAPRACRPHVAPLVAVAAGHPTSVVTCVTTTANLWPRWNPVNRQRTDHARWPPPPSGPGGPG